MSVRPRFPDVLRLAVLPTAIACVSPTMTSPQASMSTAATAGEAAPVDAAAAARRRLEAVGVLVRRVSATSDQLDVDCFDSLVADADLAVVADLGPVAVVRLRETGITDAGLAHVAKIPSLRRLHLEKTAITDAGLAHLDGHASLEHLNLLGTRVGDAGLARLARSPRLRSLVVTETAVTTSGIDALKKTSRDLRVEPDAAADHSRAETALRVAKSATAEAERLSEVAAIAEPSLKAILLHVKQRVADLQKTHAELQKEHSQLRAAAAVAATAAASLKTPEAAEQAAAAERAAKDAEVAVQHFGALLKDLQAESAGLGETATRAGSSTEVLKAARQLEAQAAERLRGSATGQP